MLLKDDIKFNSVPLLLERTTFNRRSRRATEAEINKISSHFLKLENMFINQLFNENNDLDYKDLYDHYLGRWQELTEWMILNKWFKHTALFTKYFITYYSPKETI